MKKQEHNPNKRNSMAAFLGLTAVIVLLALMMGPAQAAPTPAASIIHVDIDATGANNGSSWTDAYPNLQDALAAWTAGDEIWIAEGRYFPDVGAAQTPGDQVALFRLIDDMQLYGGFIGTESARDERVPAANVTVLSGDIDQNDVVNPNGVTLNWTSTFLKGNNSHHVVAIDHAGNTVILDGFTVTAGYAVQTSSNEVGGGIAINHFQDAHPVIRNTVIQANRAWSKGGGLYTFTTPLTVSDTVFLNNGADDNDNTDAHRPDGGGMYLGNSTPGSIAVDLRRVEFSGNSAENGGGLGSVGNNQFSTGLTLDEVRFKSNTAVSHGGGMMSSFINFVMTNASFTGNKTLPPVNLFTGDHGAIYGGGGLALLGGGSTPTLNKVVFAGNEAKIEFPNCDANTPNAGYGGGLHIIDAAPTLNNVLFSGNISEANGGGLFMMRETIELTKTELINNTFVGNLSTKCAEGHAMENNSLYPMSVSNSVIWGNNANGADAIKAVFNTTITFQNSIVQGCAYPADPSIGCGTGLGGNLNVDPDFVDQTSYTAAPTTAGSNRLKIGSPAVDKGDNSLVKAGVTTDLDNRPRIVDGDGDSTSTVDMGAYELPFACSSPVSPVLRVDKDATGANTGLTWTDALPTLQDALVLYNNCPGVDEIWVAEGVYYPDRGGYFGDPWADPLTDRLQRSFVITNDGTGGIKIYGGFAGTENSTGDRGDPALNVTVLSGDIEHDDVTDANGVLLDPSGIVGSNSNHVLYENDPTCDPGGAPDCPLLDRLTVTGGDAWAGIDGSIPAEQGGGMWSRNGVTAFNDVRFQGNQAIIGGGLILDGRSGNQLNKVVFENNWARSGGGMSVFSESDSYLDLVTFKGNRATAKGSGSPILGNGGGMYVATDSPTETKIEDSLFLHNVADNNGGGLFIEPGPFANTKSPVILSIVTFQGNQATGNGNGVGNGGGMATRGSLPQVNVDRVFFRGNSAVNGGAIANMEGANAVFFDSQITGNVANLAGGGMYNNASSPELTNLTIASNSDSGEAGGMVNWNGSNPLIRNSILWLNSNTIRNSSDSTPVVSYSLLQGCGPAGQPPTLDPACGSDGGGNIEPEHPWDPIFVHPINPATAPSVLGDFHLARTSPAIDQGNNAYNNSTYDLDGPAHPRRLDGNGDGTVTIDMGAYEAPTAGRIKVVKETLPVGSPKLFVFELTTPDDQAGRIYFALGDGETWDSSNVPPGQYTLVETRYPDWDRVSASCDDGNSFLPTIVLGGGETVTCTFRNVQRGRIIVDKVTHPTGDPQKFPFVLSGGPDNVNQNFALADGDTPHDSGYVKAGSYSVVEGNVSDWELSSAVCSDGSDPANIDLDMGETVHCTFTNLEPNTIVIRKETEPTPGSGFKFTDNIAADNHKFTLDDNQSEAFHDVQPGTYIITEDDLSPGFYLADIVCGGSFKSEFVDLKQRSLILTMKENQTAHCTFLNKGLFKYYLPFVPTIR